jgi:cytoskeletal protein CcmA (bactofilin family)
MPLVRTITQNKESMSKQQPLVPSTGLINMIGEGTIIEGTLRADSDIRISGTVVGNVQVEGKVIVAPEGSVNGELLATNADIAGDVKGKVKVKERLVLKSPARVDAELHAARLVVEEGAVFNGKCSMGEVGKASKEKPVAESGAASGESKVAGQIKAATG